LGEAKAQVTVKLHAGAIKDKEPEPAVARAPGSKADKCRFNGVFLNAGFIILFGPTGPSLT
jgi:hypothetical protein